MTPGAGRPLVHAITPGDHFSPRTGSAVPTVVDGLARHRSQGSPRPTVLVARGTYPDRYPSADVVEYAQRRSRRTDRYLDSALARVGAPRVAARRAFAAVVVSQDEWAPSFVLAHNAPALVPLVGPRHVPVLYAHNQVLRTYTTRDAGRTLAHAPVVVCVSDFLAEQVRARLPRELADRVRTVRNGVDPALLDVERADPADDGLHVVYVGRVIPDKGVHVLLAAVGALDRADVRVTVVGRAGFDARDPLTPYEQELRRTADDLRSPVRFASFLARDALPAVLATASVVVVPSTWPEPFGLTALEGMAVGAAVVASDVGGLPEAVGDGGLLVPPGDVARLADALDGLRDAQTLGQAQARARATARTRTWAVSATRLDEVLEAYR
ncbi:glycosyltransferase family 4 protein [Cellulosimicrobium sp. SH8]|uniref:glycosyltransferase family 4 protein n=1 Tax=Cellulosimicrobium sp. SH8 TaxID=2952936 RepID=UPI0021F2C1AB|nr:glycosyltransferase family 4 protein [Cellulosimicrobium sp. SH8]